MIAQEELARPANGASHAKVAAPFPPAGAEVQQIVFTAQPAADQQLLVEFPPPLTARAVLLKAGSTNTNTSLQPAGSPQGLVLLLVPASKEASGNPAEGELLGQMRNWVEAELSAGQPKSILMTLQGTQIFWTPGRCALLAPPDRWDAVRTAIVEASYFEAELRQMEQTLGAAWPQLEADMPLAFEFESAAINKRQQLSQRFQQTLLLRGQLARIGPHVHCPHLHPPTLASQVGERLRERTRMEHRYEFLDEQLEVFEEVYDMCGERASSFMLTRSGNTLEWVIIILLMAQLLFSAFEILTTHSDSTATTPATSTSTVTGAPSSASAGQ